MENKRVVWLDALKGFAIFLVVLGHCIERVKTGNSTNPILEQTDIFIYGFHFMLFFMISGYIYGLKENKRNTPEPFWHFTKVKLIDFLLNLCYDKEIINSKRYVKFGQKLDDIIKYATGWKKTINTN